MKAKLELFLIVGSLLAVLAVGGGAGAAAASGPQVTASTASAVGLPARAASVSRSCGSLEEGGFPLQVLIERGHTRCKEARHTMHAFLAGEGTEHGGRNAPEAGKYWTLHGGWRCSHVAGGGACDRGGHNYLTAREAISATAGA